jgi:hypothetical protein
MGPRELPCIAFDLYFPKILQERVTKKIMCLLKMYQSLLHAWPSGKRFKTTDLLPNFLIPLRTPHKMLLKQFRMRPMRFVLPTTPEVHY